MKTCFGKTSFGDELELFENNFITKEIFEKGIFDRDELTVLSSLFSLMPSRRVALDIGGNIGNHCGLFARHFQETHVIEANPEVYAVLSRNIERNGWKAKAYNVGFADLNGTMPFFCNESGNLGASSFSREHCAGGVLMLQ